MGNTQKRPLVVFHTLLQDGEQIKVWQTKETALQVIRGYSGRSSQERFWALSLNDTVKAESQAENR